MGEVHPVISGIRNHARHEPQKAALRCRDGEYTYPALVAMVDARARVLQMQGVRTADVIVLVARRGIAAVVDVLALWALGATAVPVEASSQPNVLHEVEKLSTARGTLLPGKELRETARASGDTPTASLIFHHAGDDGHTLQRVTVQSLERTILQEGIVHNLASRTVLGFSAIYDPGSVLETWAVLGSGGTVELVTDEDAGTDEVFVASLCFSPVDLVHATTSLLSALRVPAFKAGLLDRVRSVLVDEGARCCKQALRALFPLACLSDLRTTRGPSGAAAAL